MTTLDVKTTQDIWQRTGNDWAPGTTAAQFELLEPGLYKYCASMNGWWLNMDSPCFKFGYKTYNVNSDIIARVERAWDNTQGNNLGVLLNGVKGTGKTVTAQLLANWAIQEKKMPVLLVNNPVPLTTIVQRIHQPLMVVFDEFEKTHEKEEDQQALLTALDGMARNGYNRLYIFTTNVKNVDDNFIDRPSRIRYNWEFGRLSEKVIEEVMDDLLVPEMKHHRPAIVSYLNRRKVLSIDVVKTVINEVNVFQESPEAFAEILNLTEYEVRNFTLDVMDPNNLKSVDHTLFHFFSPHGSHAQALQALITSSGHKDYIENNAGSQAIDFVDKYNSGRIRVVGSTDDPTVWACQVMVEPSKIKWLDSFPRARKLMEPYSAVWLSAVPSDWRPADWVLKLEKGKKLNSQEEELLENYRSCGHSHLRAGQDDTRGNGQAAVIPIKITAMTDANSSGGGGTANVWSSWNKSRAASAAEPYVPDDSED